MFYYLCKEYTKYSLSDIGSYLNQDHATVIHGIKTINDILETDFKARIDYTNLKSLLTNTSHQAIDLDRLKYALTVLNTLLHSKELAKHLEPDVIDDLTNICMAGNDELTRFQRLIKSQNLRNQ